jgi:Peptidase inhibitor family I36
MHAVSDARKMFSSALIVLALLVGALLVAAPKASAERSQCSSNTVCVWSQSGYEGNFSQWGPNTGCHNHEGNPSLRSVWNRTNRTIEIPARFNLGPGGAISLTAGEPSITGVICT